MRKITHRIVQRVRRYGFFRTAIFFIWWLSPPKLRKVIDRTIIKCCRLLRIGHLKIAVNETEIFTVPKYPFVIVRYFLAGRYDEEEIAAIRRWTPSNYSFIDVGANFGVWTFSLADHFTQTFAFEPDPECFDCLKKTKRYLNKRNVSLFNMALSDENKEGFLFPSRSNKGDGRIYDPGDGARLDRIKIQIRTFDTMVHEKAWDMGHLFLKLDVQGAEPWVLIGMKNFLKQAKDVILWTEVQNAVLESAGLGADNYFFLLKELGFKPINLDDNFKVMDFHHLSFDLKKKKDLCFRLQKE